MHSRQSDAISGVSGYAWKQSHFRTPLEPMYLALSDYNCFVGTKTLR